MTRKVGGWMGEPARFLKDSPDRPPGQLRAEIPPAHSCFLPNTRRDLFFRACGHEPSRPRMGAGATVLRRPCDSAFPAGCERCLRLPRGTKSKFLRCLRRMRSGLLPLRFGPVVAVPIGGFRGRSLHIRQITTTLLTRCCKSAVQISAPRHFPPVPKQWLPSFRLYPENLRRARRRQSCSSNATAHPQICQSPDSHSTSAATDPAEHVDHDLFIRISPPLEPTSILLL